MDLIKQYVVFFEFYNVIKYILNCIYPVDYFQCKHVPTQQNCKFECIFYCYQYKYTTVRVDM